jgi:hypothetical protein
MNTASRVLSMYERLLKQTERYLENRTESAVSVKQLWDAMVKEGTKRDFAVPSLMADFECLLEGDKRFEFVAEGHPRGGENPGLEELLEHEELEKLGFLSSQRVRLRRTSLLSLETDDEELHDALDAAVSLEDLGDNFPDTSLFDGDSAEKAPSRREPVSRTPKRVSSESGGRRATGGNIAKPTKKVAPKKPSAKKRKK